MDRTEVERLDRVEELAKQFKELKETWIEETCYISSPEESSTHPAYQDIIGLGLPVVPFLIKDMKKNNTHWFWALRAITGANPVPDEHRGNISAMADDWAIWWKEKMELVSEDTLSKLA